jgi:hypothetical protein
MRQRGWVGPTLLQQQQRQQQHWRYTALRPASLNCADSIRRMLCHDLNVAGEGSGGGLYVAIGPETVAFTVGLDTGNTSVVMQDIVTNNNTAGGTCAWEAA